MSSIFFLFIRLDQIGQYAAFWHLFHSEETWSLAPAQTGRPFHPSQERSFASLSRIIAMKIHRALTWLLLASCAFAGCSSRQPPAPRNLESPPVPPTEVVDTNVCEIAKTPDQFHGKLVRVDAYLSWEFEDSSFHDPSCPDEALTSTDRHSVVEPRIWVELGSHVDYWGVKGFAPLVDDEKLRRLRAMLIERQRMKQMTRAILNGTFFAGERVKVNGRVTSHRGFGHMGCCSLFVLSRAEWLQKDYRSDLNYSWADWNIGIPEGCYSAQFLALPTNEMVRSWQQAANEGQGDWRMDPKLVAEDYLQAINWRDAGSRAGRKTELVWPDKRNLKPPDASSPTETLMESSPPSSYLKRYEVISSDRATRVVVVVARPYWLEKLAGAGGVIWAPVGGSVIRCVVPHKKEKNR